MSQWHESDVRGILDPVLILQYGLDVRVGDDHVVQLQLRRLALRLHGSDQIHRGSVKQNSERRGGEARKSQFCYTTWWLW